jgi:hypothetical protein
MSLPTSGQQRLQDFTGGLLMQAVFGIGGAGTESLFQKVDANAGSATNLFQCGRNPRLAFDHLRKQRQSHGDHFAVLGQTRSRGSTNDCSSSVRLPDFAGSLPNACPNLTSTFSACSTSNRSMVAKLWPWTMRNID